MKYWRDLFHAALVMAALLPLWAGSGFADAHEEAPAGTSKPMAEADVESHADELRASFETFREARHSRLREIAALELDADTAVGEDQVALRSQALEWSLEGADTLKEMWGVIEELEVAEGDASANQQRQALAVLLPGLQDSIVTQHSRLAAERDKLKAEQAGLGDADAAAALGFEIDRKESSLLRMFDVGIELIVLLEAVDRTAGPGAPQRAWLEERLERGARLAMSRVRLTQERLSEVASRDASGSDPAVLQAAEAAATVRAEVAADGLGRIVDLMDRLDLDTASHHQLLIESTGEITVDAIGSGVASELVSRWTADAQEGVAANGARLAFQAFLFILIAVSFWGLSRFVRSVVARAVEAPHLRFSQLLKRMLVSLSTGAVLILGLLIALSQLGIEVAPMLAGLGIAGFVLGFALQDTLGNFAAGVMILIYRPYDVGDMIDCAGGVFGQVSHMSLVSTTILTIDNKTLIVPNNKIWGDVITNVTAQDNRRIDLEFGIGYGDDIPHAEEVLWSIIKDHPKVLAEPEPVVKVHSLGDSSVNLIVRPWVARDDYWDVYWDFMREVKLRFDREGISIPFPQRDVHFYPSEEATAASENATGKNAAPMEISATPESARDEPDEEG